MSICTNCNPAAHEQRNQEYHNCSPGFDHNQMGKHSTNAMCAPLVTPPEKREEAQKANM